MTEPTDAELDALRQADNGALNFVTARAFRIIARTVLAKWGTPPAVAPWRSAVLDLIDDCPGLTMEQDQWLSRRVKELDFASTPQPTQAQAGAVPQKDEPDCGGESCDCRNYCKKKGGQHGADT